MTDDIQKQIAHIMENIDLFREHQMDPDVDYDYVVDYFMDHKDEPIYLYLCSDLDLTPIE